MSLTLHYHPLASFCWKALIALYENETSFTPLLVDLADERSRSDFLKVWPMGEFPVLVDGRRNRTVPQSAVIIEYLSMHYAGKTALIPADPDLAIEARLWNEIFDDYLHVPMQRIVADVLRPADRRDPLGVSEWRETLRSTYDFLEARLKDRRWCLGEEFTMADCSAAPALFYADQVEPLGAKYPVLASYLERLRKRPSFARVLQEARPYFHMFPIEGKRAP